jgi:hypothetical protein
VPEPATLTPVRLQLSRTRGFRLHQLSHATNGLPARRVDRTTPYGNPFRHVSDEGILKITSDEETARRAVAGELVQMFRDWLDRDPVGQRLAARVRAELRGHNLACWCRLDRPCHADIELEIANA